MKIHTGFSPELEKAHGSFEYPLTNDYMFRALFQRNNKALKGLISSLLRLPIDEIHSVEITNPIVLGDEYTDKEFHLDIKAELNHDKLINLEMQVTNFGNWPERSLSYLCRMFDNVCRGEDYQQVEPVIHISILNFTLFDDAPAFYSCNKLMDEKTHHLYSDKLSLNVLDLSHTELATEEDKLWKLDYWARLFKASTWEDLKMIASNDEYLTEASNTLYDMYNDFNIRERLRSREDYIIHQRRMDNTIKQQQEELEQQKEELILKDNALVEKDSQITEQASQITEKDSQIEQLLEEIARLKADQNK